MKNTNVKNLNIKINRLAAIQALENKLADMNSKMEAARAEQVAHSLEMQGWMDEVEHEITAGNWDFHHDRYYGAIYRCHDGCHRVMFEFQNLPTQPKEPTTRLDFNQADIDQLAHIIRLLKLSTDENISTMVYGSLGWCMVPSESICNKN